MTMLAPTALWAKLQRDTSGTVVAWHSLVAHSIEVAAVLGTLLRQPTIVARLSVLGERALDEVMVARLCVLAILHDVGKANRGFQARVDPHAPFVGHIDPVAWLVHSADAADLYDPFAAILGLDELAAWLAPDPMPWIEAIFAHHGAPWRREPPNSRALWRPGVDGDPIAQLGAILSAMRQHHPVAFEAGGLLPAATAFHHAFAGLLMLADWLASDTAFFPLRNGAVPTPDEARAAADRAVSAVGIDAGPARDACHPSQFQVTFGHLPRGMQTHTAEPSALCVVLEAETGSGKTEAALWRFKTLFEQGVVDGLYFALPTRVAATAMFARVRAFRDAVFGKNWPPVVLAVPGQVAVDEAEGHPLPGFGFEWTDHPEGDAARRRWAAEHPKRFLAAPIAVGTVDQALLGAIRVRHSQMRGAALLRHLLVVDEVHASDPYMSVLLGTLLRNHGQAGGHVLLLSATLGAAARSGFLGTPCPSAAEAEALPYPALTWADKGQDRHLFLSQPASSPKVVRMEQAPHLERPDAIAARALAAAKMGARVLVIRNTVRAAVATMQAVERLAPYHPALFRVAGVPTLHHSRFAPADRRALDGAVEAALGHGTAGGGRVVVGTQTLEVSLDLDADLLITDLCPADVLLQRMGRLHRHDRTRPSGFTTARTVVLVPETRSLVRFARRQGSRHGLGLVYADLRTVEATWRLLEADPVWITPAHNRHLVERSTHPEHLARIEHDLAAEDQAWLDHLHQRNGRSIAQLSEARSACLLWSTPFDALLVPSDERLATRLGARDRQVDLPHALRSAFGLPVQGLKIPHYLADAIPPEAEPRDVTRKDEGITFTLGEAVFVYDRWGLRMS